MILRKILLGLIVVGFIVFIIDHLESCRTREEQAKAKIAPVKRYQVKLLFDIDGCKVYSFQDGSIYNYFTNCNGSVSQQRIIQSGKTTTVKYETID
ncbi:hypothetical protein [Flectobacillus roseus]|uniref:hypothetical protein n=1 Tax=Flectobacillus roseus TaxID=502259 RepID=UPI0024B66155|nr:hypothetical protein [Flectobacillus roseus]MDI9870603.1 hypothetical protein [Flectobacillus roseus]